MEMMEVPNHRERSTSDNMNRHLDSNGKYVRYTSEQVEALERVYSECPKPSSLRRQQLIRECPILANIEPKQIKVWFQNRRCRDKQRKEASRLQSVNRKLSAMNKLLMEENDRLQKQVSQLVCENGYMKQQLTTVVNDVSCDSVVTTPKHSIRDANSPAGLISIAEEALAEFLSKATGTAVDWVQMPGMKPGPDSVGIFAISQRCSGVAARACDRPSWYRDCRSLEVFTMFPARNGGTIELVYMQTYAPTTLAPARDFWTLRYTTSLDNGSYVVCERSLSGSGAGPNAASASQFVRAEMLSSGYLIRPCDGGGSIIHIVDHLNLEVIIHTRGFPGLRPGGSAEESTDLPFGFFDLGSPETSEETTSFPSGLFAAWSVPDVLRPLYESSKVVAQKMTISGLRYIRQLAQESNGELVYGLGRQPAVLRTFSQRLSRGFNDAVNGFGDDGWSTMHCDGSEDIIVAINSTKHLSNISSSLSFLGGVLCAKASMLLQNVPPAVLIQFLREHRSEWADFHVDAYSAATLKAGAFAYHGVRPTRFTGSQIIMPLGHTIEHEETLEVVRLEGHSLAQEDAFMSRDVHLLQGDGQDLITSNHRTLDLTSSLEVGPSPETASGDSSSSCSSSRCILTIAFQFPFEPNLQENVAGMACQYVRSVISSVQRVAMAISPSGISPGLGSKLSPGSPEAVTLSQWISQSYTHHLGSELVTIDSLGSNDSVLKLIWDHQDAILCCTLKSQPVFMFANQAGLDMLETTLVALQDITLEKIFDESGRKALCSDFAKLMQQGFACLPSGICLSTMGRHVTYEQAVAWKVFAASQNDNNNSLHCLAFSFVNWSFV
ncbi:hypothetical protein HID58_045789 [Brassica napus]|uniref:Uncharacterized protein n=1 Tax=Brassica napus TaxID=3708 RepID=A0ABQ8AUL5_BRANA|nr:hypothetical protein HID58_045789 [Brassica napus]